MAEEKEHPLLAFHARLALVPLKHAMTMPYPKVPDPVKKLLIMGPLAPLGDLMHRGGYSVGRWDIEADIQSWYGQLPDRPPLYPFFTIYYWNYLSQMVGLFRDKNEEIFGSFESGAIARPEGCLFRRGDATPVLLFLLDFFNLPDKLDLVQDRLVNYMEITGARFGVLTNLNSSWLCKRATANELLVSSPAMNNPLMALGFAVEVARKEGLPPLTGVRSVLPKLDFSPVLEILELVCKLSNIDPRKIVDKAVTDDGFKFEDLRQVDTLPLHRDGNANQTVFAVRAKYAGQDVVVKIRDLTSQYKAGINLGLAKLATEVDCYTRLKNVQGSAVPKLLSWGFLKGAMFVFVMMTDGGFSELEQCSNPSKFILSDEGETLKQAMECLRAIHKRGIAIRDINTSKVVSKVDEAGKLHVKLVGFGGALITEVLSQEWYEATARDVALLEKACDPLSPEKLIAEVDRKRLLGKARRDDKHSGETMEDGGHQASRSPLYSVAVDEAE
ncbi:hypothetical protein SELMODRAFT_412790 [Selaginella moellendorffii]|uniref:Protein kinase domain-containing protein n=1 Tax=Selaginella moellendorffii TaxID=88036 RepID=D8RMA9_SELML|nr:hypothetical protein SELMODRAFT_412790 [Selaginella moellendorffii]